MLRIGLSGGIGSGKSTVSARLAELGAVVIDADVVAREVVEPGTPGLTEIAERFGPGVIGTEGRLDRPALGALVFADDVARRDLEAITHPRIHTRSAELMAAAAPDAVVVHDIPLLVEMGREAHYALTVIVDVPEQVRLDRLVELRGMPADQARARITAQADDEARHAAADVLLDNTGTVEQLLVAVDELWHERLVPFEAALRVGGPASTVTRPADDYTTDEARRVLSRLRAALRDHVVANGPGELELTVDTLQVLDAPATQDSLRAKGLLVHPATPRDTGAGARQVVWVDPVQPVAWVLREAARD